MLIVNITEPAQQISCYLTVSLFLTLSMLNLLVFGCFVTVLYDEEYNDKRKILWQNVF